LSWFLYLAPDYLDKIALLEDGDGPDQRRVLLRYLDHVRAGVEVRFLDEAQPGDICDVDGGKGERFLIRLGRSFDADEGWSP